MEMFLSKFINKVDKKGRVSVPAQFRQVLKEHSFNGVIAYNSFINPCIEVCSMIKMVELAKRIESLEEFSAVRHALAITLLGESIQLPFDTEGRIVIPETLLIKAEIKENAAFIGKGSTFEIWDPIVLQSYSITARQLAQEHRSIIKSV